MLTLPALKVQQFAQEFYLLNLVAADVERLLRFEVLGEAGIRGKRPSAQRKTQISPVNWEQIEQQVQTSERAYQRPVLRKKLVELASYYLQCKDDGAVPAIPGAVLLTSERPVEFVSESNNPFVGVLKLDDSESSLRVLDGQHRLLALMALLGSPELPDSERTAARLLQVPAVLFVGLSPASVVEMFVTINSKHTRLNSSLLFSLKGRQLYGDPLDARAHDTLVKLNEGPGSPLEGQIKMLGVGKGKVSQSSLAGELRKVLTSLKAGHGRDEWFEDFIAHAPRFYLAYFREIARLFETEWSSRHYALQAPAVLRSFLQASEQVAIRVMHAGGDPRQTLRTLLAPWKEKIGAERFRVDGAWGAHVPGGSRNVTRTLARELVDALEATP